MPDLHWIISPIESELYKFVLPPLVSTKEFVRTRKVVRILIGIAFTFLIDEIVSFFFQLKVFDPVLLSIKLILVALALVTIRCGGIPYARWEIVLGACLIAIIDIREQGFEIMFQTQPYCFAIVVVLCGGTISTVYFSFIASLIWMYPSALNQTERYTGVMKMALMMILMWFFETHEEDVELCLCESELARRSAISESKKKTEFLRKMCHEIRTPLHGILGYLELLSTLPKSELGSKGDEYVFTALSCGQQLLSVLNCILTLENPSCIDIHEVSVEMALKNATSVMGMQVMAKRLTMEAVISPGVPKFIMSNKIYLYQALTNLISNAIKFTEKGGLIVSARLAHRNCLLKKRKPTFPPEFPFEWYIQWTVKDTGVGIDPEFQAKLWQPFVQVHRDDRGTGLGLSLVRQLLESMEGFVMVESEGFGKGSEFSLFTPHRLKDIDRFTETLVVASYVPKHEELEEDEERRSKHVKTPPKHPHQKYVLVAEDNLVSQKMLYLILQDMGFCVHLANNGEEALQLVGKGCPYQFALLDWEMPVMNGLEAAKKVKQMSPDLPLFLLTAHSLEEDLQMALKYGFQDCLTKPFTRKELTLLLQNHNLINHEDLPPDPRVRALDRGPIVSVSTARI